VAAGGKMLLVGGSTLSAVVNSEAYLMSTLL
jgi:hypothetical protein